MDISNIKNLDLNLLRTFVVLMEERNVSRAADRLNISQSATSNALERLRESLDDQVMAREGRAMQPTRSALLLWPKISTALSAIEEALASSRELNPESMKATFNIGIDQYTMLLFGNSLVETVSANAPDVKLSFRIADTSRYSEQIMRSEVDLIVAPVWQSLAGLEKERLYTEDFIGLIRKGHPLARKKMTVKRFVSYPHLLISPRGIVNGNIDAGLQKLGEHRDVVLTTPWFDAAPSYLMKSDLILNMGRQLAAKMMNQYELAQFELPLKAPGFDVCMLWHPRNSADSYHQWLRDSIRSDFSLPGSSGV